MAATDKQKAHLEKAREVRNENQAQLTKIKELEAQLEKWDKLRVLFHDDSFSFTLHARRINNLRNDWPELFDELVNLTGPVPY